MLRSTVPGGGGVAVGPLGVGELTGNLVGDGDTTAVEVLVAVGRGVWVTFGAGEGVDVGDGRGVFSICAALGM